MLGSEMAAVWLRCMVAAVAGLGVFTTLCCYAMLCDFLPAEKPQFYSGWARLSCMMTTATNIPHLIWAEGLGGFCQQRTSMMAATVEPDPTKFGG